MGEAALKETSEEDEDYPCKKRPHRKRPALEEAPSNEVGELLSEFEIARLEIELENTLYHLELFKPQTLQDYEELQVSIDRFVLLKFAQRLGILNCK